MAHDPTEEEMLAEWKALPFLVRAFMLCIGVIVTLYMLVTGQLRAHAHPTKYPEK